MKHMNIVVSAIIIVAVLVAAYAVGLLVRHARTQDGQSRQTTEDLNARVGQQMPGGRYSRGADEDAAAKIREQRQQKLEQMKQMSEEEKRKITEDEVRQRFGAGRPRSHEMSPKQRAEAMRRHVLPEDANQAPPQGASEPNKAGQK